MTDADISHEEWVQERAGILEFSAHVSHEAALPMARYLHRRAGDAD